MPLLSMSREAKAIRSGESWLPRMTKTWTFRWASRQRKSSKSSTASAGGTGLSYTSPATITAWGWT